MRIKKKKNSNHKKIEQLASKFTLWVGSPSSIVAHSIFFILCFLSPLVGLEFDRMLLFLTTIVSLEAIYLGIFIQYSVNRSSEHLQKVQEDVHEIQEDVHEIQEDVGEIEKDIDEIQEDVDEIEEGEEKESKRDENIQVTMQNIQVALSSLIKDIEKLKNESKNKSQK